MTDKNVIKQILMNELGLTREYVRGIVAEVVADTVQRRFEQSGYLHSLLETLVKQELSRLIIKRESYSSDDHLTQLVKSAVKDEVHRAVSERIKIEVVSKEQS